VTQDDEIIMISEQGQGIRFAVKGLRPASRTSGGVRGIRLDKGDHMVAMNKVFGDAILLTVTVNGYGKRTRVRNFPLQARGGKGVIAHKVNDKTKKVIAAMLVPPGQHLIIVTSNGIIVRVPVDEEISLVGRDTQGVRVNRLEPDDSVASIALVQQGEEKGDAKAGDE
jgi:DNA gyrase subunit A